MTCGEEDAESGEISVRTLSTSASLEEKGCDDMNGEVAP